MLPQAWALGSHATHSSNKRSTNSLFFQLEYHAEVGGKTHFT
jgi:hypothetical protein